VPCEGRAPIGALLTSVLFDRLSIGRLRNGDPRDWDVVGVIRGFIHPRWCRCEDFIHASVGNKLTLFMFRVGFPKQAPSCSYNKVPGPYNVIAPYPTISLLLLRKYHGILWRAPYCIFKSVIIVRFHVGYE
jgi:hypothetical protein